MANAVVSKTIVRQDLRVRIPSSALMIAIHIDVIKQEMKGRASKFSRSRRIASLLSRRPKEVARHIRFTLCYGRGMTLREFLVERSSDSRGPAEDRLRIREYSDAVTKLTKRIRDFLIPYKALGLEIEEWVPLIKERWIPYNAPALTVRFRDDEIVIEPKGTFVVNGLGRVSMTRGMREVHLDWLGDDNWTFRWVLPRTTKATPFTDQDIEDIVLGLLS